MFPQTSIFVNACRNSCRQHFCNLVFYVMSARLVVINVFVQLSSFVLFYSKKCHHQFFLLINFSEMSAESYVKFIFVQNSLFVKVGRSSCFYHFMQIIVMTIVCRNSCHHLFLHRLLSLINNAGLIGISVLYR